jgi:predicted peptidase
MKRAIGIIAILFTTTMFAQTEKTGSFKTEIVQKVELGYLLHIPKEVKSKKPLIVFLHGSGEKGTDVELLRKQGPLKYIKEKEIDAYILAPQCRENEYWNEESIYRLIQKIVKENNIDADRICLTGLSLGGWGTLKLGIAHPEMFAALVPICGFVDRLDIDDLCKIAAIPTRIYHGLLDDVVDVNYATVIYKTLRACNANVKLTIFEDANHNSWDNVYDNAEIYDWMLSQSKTATNK